MHVTHIIIYKHRYTVRASDKNKRLYLASSRALACAAGQRVLVSVDDFKQGTLAEALELVKQTSYQTTEGAQSLIERIWCFEDHCPTPALGFYGMCASLSLSTLHSLARVSRLTLLPQPLRATQDSNILQRK